MELLDRIQADLKEAMLSRNAAVTATLRLLKSELKNAEIASSGPFTEDSVLHVIRREVRKRMEAAQTFAGIGATDRQAQEESEAALLQNYLPASADVATIEVHVASLKAQGLAKGDLIKQTLAHFKGTAEGRTVAEIVNRLF